MNKIIERNIVRSNEVDIPKENPFLNDKLDRRQYVDVLTDIVNAFSDSGCVMSLSGEWGSGKTTFVKMWQQHLENNGYTTLYYNAWENDYVDDPVIALVSELKEIGGESETYKKVVSGLGRISLALAKGLTKKFFGIEKDDISSLTMDEFQSIGNQSIEDYTNQKTTLNEFKNTLSQFVENNSDKLPIIFFIDELDRCNPTFAVRTLERIKHLFDIPNIFFVLSISRKPLEAAIKGYYGSSEIDANEYLRRFIDYDFPLQQPELETYCSFLIERYGIENYFLQKLSTGHDAYSEFGYFKSIVTEVCKYLQLNLRLIDKLLIQTRLSLWGCKPENQLTSLLIFMLCQWKITDSEFYNKLYTHAYNEQELLTECEERLRPVFNGFIERNQTNYERYFTFMVVELLLKYIFSNGRCLNEDFFKKLKDAVNNQFVDLPLTFTLFKTNDFHEALSNYITHRYAQSVESGLSFLLSRIELQYGLTSK